MTSWMFKRFIASWTSLQLSTASLSVYSLTRFPKILPFFWEISPFQGLRELYVQPKDVIYFIHDSASYMNPAAERLKQDFGYSNMVHVPCWSHLLALIGKPIFDQKLLPELSEYLRLSKYVLW